jgi:hypothetical protein
VRHRPDGARWHRGVGRHQSCGQRADKANRTIDRLEREVAEILRQAAEADQREDLEYGQARGDELPDALASKASRLVRLRQAKDQLEAEADRAPRDWERFYRQAVEFHVRNARRWANSATGEDLTSQVDPTFILRPDPGLQAS